ncbi:MAG: 2-amino-4-hydroxy-6-hydroxymethyldihydropteridine diphosphokinase [Planctomycetes bacterium]|nr:2-amino-4-hydroxy-6-hydroxymethyldihydropteridine diphosphokinase [Planctomycetota bacterium]
MAPDPDDIGPGGTAWTPALLAVGSNLGDREAAIRGALALLGGEPDVGVTAVSRWKETEPAGGPPQGPYLNGAVAIRTRLAPRALLAVLQAVEARLGRVRGPRWGPRTIDLDILLYGDLVVRAPDLEIPHPRMLERVFVLEPAAEVAAGWVHPVTGRTVLEHLRLLRAEAAPAGGLA